jgi:hypothetical protein
MIVYCCPQAKSEARKQKSRDRVRDRESRDVSSSGTNTYANRGVSVIGGNRAQSNATALTFGSAHLPVFGAPVTLTSSTLTERQTAGIAVERASLQVFIFLLFFLFSQFLIY